MSWAIAALVPLRIVVAQTPAVTLDHESKHHPVLSNSWVRVLDVIVPAVDSTLYHVHPNDYVYITFGPVSLKAQPAGSPQTDLVLSNGEVRFTKAPITHRVVNPSGNPFHNLTIELLKRSGKTLSPAVAGEVVLDNERVRVVRIILEPGQSGIEHTHVGPELDVAISPGSMSSKDPRGNQRRIRYRSGEYEWNQASRTHVLSNVGQTRIEIVEVEWK